jgi:aldehyde dehydrogenase (NAD+)
VADRVAILERAMAAYLKRSEELAQTMSAEMGAPIVMARQAQVGSAFLHLKVATKLLPDFSFEENHGAFRLHKEPIGVCGLITPWNWPANQIMCKLAPALATGCTVVLKPSEMAPLNAILIVKAFEEAGVPAGVINLVNGDGPGVGSAMSQHPDISMISFTGSTRAGIAVAESSAASVKRVTQELGGKSANIILDDADFAKAVSKGVIECMNNSGQTCLAPTRMLVPAELHDQAVAIAKATAEKIRLGDPKDETSYIGPLAHGAQYTKVTGLITAAIEQGSELVCGGTERPEGLEKGYYVKPTIFANVSNDMLIAQEEVFGPVLCIMPYSTEAEAIAIANDSPYGLAGYVQSENEERALAVARQMETGYVLCNGASLNFNAPLAGHKQSGNGAEWGEAGFDDYLVTKSIVGLASN